MVRTLDDCSDEHDRQIIEDIHRCGWHVVIVEDGRPGWSFSVGLFQTFRHPEVIVFGLGNDVGCEVINGIGAAIRAGNRFEAEQDYAEILANVRCTFKPVHQRWYQWVLGYACWYYKRDDFPVLQCLWPDKRQFYPWQPEFKAEWVWAQPLLFHEDRVARAVELLDSMEGLAVRDNHRTALFSRFGKSWSAIRPSCMSPTTATTMDGNSLVAATREWRTSGSWASARSSKGTHRSASLLTFRGVGTLGVDRSARHGFVSRISRIPALNSRVSVYGAAVGGAIRPRSAGSIAVG